MDSALTVSLIGPLLLSPEAVTLAFTALCWGPFGSLLPVSLNLPTRGHATQCTLVRWLSSSRTKYFLVHLVNDDWFCKLLSRVFCNLSFLHVTFVSQPETHFCLVSLLMLPQTRLSPASLYWLSLWSWYTSLNSLPNQLQYYEAQCKPYSLGKLPQNSIPTPSFLFWGPLLHF